MRTEHLEDIRRDLIFTEAFHIQGPLHLLYHLVIAKTQEV